MSRAVRYLAAGLIGFLPSLLLAQMNRPAPLGVQVLLDKKYPGWKLIQVSPSYEESRQKMVAYAEDQIRKGKAKREDFADLDKLKRDELQPSNMIFGDFNGDGVQDCALIIKRLIPQTLIMLAYLKEGDAYREQLLESVPVAADYTLMLAKKGEPIGDEVVGPDKDYIRVDSPNASAHWFVFKDGKFIHVDSPLTPAVSPAAPPEVVPAPEPNLSTAPIQAITVPSSEAPTPSQPLDPNSIRFLPEASSSTEPTPAP